MRRAYARVVARRDDCIVVWLQDVMRQHPKAMFRVLDAVQKVDYEAPAVPLVVRHLEHVSAVQEVHVGRRPEQAGVVARADDVDRNPLRTLGVRPEVHQLGEVLVVLVDQLLQTKAVGVYPAVQHRVERASGGARLQHRVAALAPLADLAVRMVRRGQARDAGLRRGGRLAEKFPEIGDEDDGGDDGADALD